MNKKPINTTYDPNLDYWNKIQLFHGHACGGLAIGYKAALYALNLLDIQFSEDEEVVCIAENDSCAIDSFQIVLGTTLGKGNLLFHITGKQAYSVFDRKTGKSVRLVLKETPAELTHEDFLPYYLSKEPKELFDVKPTTLEIPEYARIFKSYKCDGCGEIVGANWIRLEGEKRLCLDCFHEYDRFKV